jgi:MFS family permease
VIRAIFQAVGGELADRLGRYPLMVSAQLFRSVVFWVIAFAIHSHWGFYAVGGLLIFNSIFGALFQPAANATVADVVDIEKRTEGYSIVRVAGNFGWALGPAMGGFLADKSYAILFLFSGGMTLVSSIIIGLFMRGIRRIHHNEEKFSLREMLTVKGNELILKYAALLFILYLVVSQFIMPFSLYSVDFMGISKKELGFLFAINGLMVTFFQIPTTRLLRGVRLTIQMSIGALVYAAGFLWIGLTSTFLAFALAMAVITTGENVVSPPSLAITANLAPRGRMGRYMGIYGFAVTGGWSLGPLLGGTLLDWAKPDFVYAWSVVAALAIMSSIGFGYLTRQVPPDLNQKMNNQ